MCSGISPSRRLLVKPVTSHCISEPEAGASVPALGWGKMRHRGLGPVPELVGGDCPSPSPSHPHPRTCRVVLPSPRDPHCLSGRAGVRLQPGTQSVPNKWLWNEQATNGLQPACAQGPANDGSCSSDLPPGENSSGLPGPQREELPHLLPGWSQAGPTVAQVQDREGSVPPKPTRSSLLPASS